MAHASGTERSRTNGCGIGGTARPLGPLRGLLVRCRPVGTRRQPRTREPAPMTEPRTIVEKIWDDHVVTQDPGAPAVLAIDLHLVHEVTSPQAFTGLRARGLRVRRPGQTVATADHSIPTTPARPADPRRDGRRAGRASSRTTAPSSASRSTASARPSQGIVHVIGPRAGPDPAGHDHRLRRLATPPPTARSGRWRSGSGPARSRWSWRPRRCSSAGPKTYEVRVDGRLAPGVSAKDIILALIARIGIGGGTGHVFEYRGDAIRALTMEQRMTICNMSIEGGARAGLIAPDDTTFEYLHGRRHAPQGAAWDAAVAALAHAADRRRRRVRQDRSPSTRDALEPMVTYGTNPGMGIPITGRVPSPADQADPAAAAGARARARVHGPPARARRSSARRSTSSSSAPARTAGSATCASPPSVLQGRHVAAGVRMMVVPGSDEVKKRGRAARASTRSSRRPAPNGARPAARCASP